MEFPCPFSPRSPSKALVLSETLIATAEKSSPPKIDFLAVSIFSLAVLSSLLEALKGIDTKMWLSLNSSCESPVLESFRR